MRRSACPASFPLQHSEDVLISILATRFPISFLALCMTFKNQAGFTFCSSSKDVSKQKQKMEAFSSNIIAKMTFSLCVRKGDHSEDIRIVVVAGAIKMKIGVKLTRDMKP